MVPAPTTSIYFLRFPWGAPHLPDKKQARISLKAELKAGINLYATVQTLRHNFATHLLGKGVDLMYIQKLLEYESNKTTEKIYKHITKKGMDKIKNPLDAMDI